MSSKQKNLLAYFTTPIQHLSIPQIPLDEESSPRDAKVPKMDDDAIDAKAPKMDDDARDAKAPKLDAAARDAEAPNMNAAAIDAKAPKMDDHAKNYALTAIKKVLDIFEKNHINEIGSMELQAIIKQHTRQFAAIDENINPSWFRALFKEFSEPYFKKLSDFLVTERSVNTVYPPAHQVWAWTRIPVEDIKVVILGQDPYHGKGQAHGLCFSVPPGITVPPSLRNIYNELTTDIKDFKKPNHGNLTGWCEQGVLLLNATLTVRASQAKSHADKGWEILTDSVIEQVNTRCTGVVFLLWGAHAQSKAAFIDKKKHHILMSVHPSPLSAHRGFLGCKHFSKCNALLEQQGKKTIDWNHLPEK